MLQEILQAMLAILATAVGGVRPVPTRELRANPDIWVSRYTSWNLLCAFSGAGLDLLDLRGASNLEIILLTMAWWIASIFASVIAATAHYRKNKQAGICDMMGFAAVHAPAFAWYYHKYGRPGIGCTLGFAVLAFATQLYVYSLHAEAVGKSLIPHHVALLVVELCYNLLLDYPVASMIIKLKVNLGNSK